MSFVRIDDRIGLNGKMLKAGPEACWVWVCGLAFLQRTGEQVIPFDVAFQHGSLEQIDRLKEAGLWEQVEGGYVVVPDDRLFRFSRFTLTPAVRLQLRRIRYYARKLLPELLQRSGGRCVYCGRSDGPFEVDHVVPLARGGSNDIDNLAAACRDCNNAKGAKSPQEFARVL